MFGLTVAGLMPTLFDKFAPERFHPPSSSRFSLGQTQAALEAQSHLDVFDSRFLVNAPMSNEP